MPKVTRAPAARARQRGFFDFSVSELAIIFGLALVVLGPKKLPVLVAQIGRWVGRARHMARQFREQLEQEVNSINAVKPVPRHVQPEVGPATPSPEVAAANAATVHPAPEPPPTAPAPIPEPVAGVPADPMDHEPSTIGEAERAAAAAPHAGEVHPEAQMYFAMNGSEPAIVTENPYAPAAAAPEPQGDLFAGTEARPQPANEPASVEVVFPHDHG